MKNVLKKAGWTIVSFLPVLLLLGIQAGCSFVAVVLTAVLMIIRNGDSALNDMELQNIVSQRVMENLIPILMVSQALAVLVFGLWYYLVYGKKKRPEGTPKPVPFQILLIVVLGIAAQFFTSGILTLVENFAPWLMESYNELMEQAGILEGTALALISTVVLAPLSEELVCRGVIFRLAGKVSPRFWAANFIQALAFGILHGNLVQGIYAFGLGLVLGLLYGKFRNIWLCMLLHAVMNASSLMVSPVYTFLSPNPEEMSVGVCTAVTALSAAMLALCIKALFIPERYTSNSSA